jgi:hypothetical protein
VSETAASVEAFFEGCKVQIGKEVVDCPGWRWAMAQSCDKTNSDNILAYSACLDRIASVDETVLMSNGTHYGVVPRGARRPSRGTVDIGENITVICACTFTGKALPCHYIIQATEIRENFRTTGSYIICRPDGYFITWVQFKAYLESLSRTIPGARP